MATSDGSGQIVLQNVQENIDHAAMCTGNIDYVTEDNVSKDCAEEAFEETLKTNILRRLQRCDGQGQSGLYCLLRYCLRICTLAFHRAPPSTCMAHV